MTDTKQTNPKDMVGTRKAGISCVPQAVLAELGVAMLEGACKYGRFNWRASGVRASVYLHLIVIFFSNGGMKAKTSILIASFLI